MVDGIEQSSTILALTFFKFVIVGVGLFYSILESSRQKKSAYAVLSWGLGAYFLALVFEILAEPSIAPSTIFMNPFFRILSDTLATGGLLILAHALVSHRLINRGQFTAFLRFMIILLVIIFAGFSLVSLISPDAASNLFWHAPLSSGEIHGIFPGEWVFSIQQALVLFYALAVLITQVKERALYAQGFFLFLGLGRIIFIVYLASETGSRFQAFSHLMEGLLDP
ncbi:MAG TPA: hypothetical protein ENN67_08915, partial [Firmicutes bacterium]|nr:hypothetical protein [Bacillota bacterium]